MEWRKCFRAEVIKRGEDYFRSGMVSELTYDLAGDFQAQVHGSNDYEVQVHLDSQQKLRDFECDCPHFQDGNNCKHIAAVLLKWEDAQHNSGQHSSSSNRLRTIPELRQEISNVCWNYIGPDNFIEYGQVYLFAQEMLRFLDHDAEIFLRHQQFADAFKLTNLLLEKFLNVSLDDNGDGADFCTEIFATWEKIYQDCNVEFRQEMFNWFIEELQHSSTKSEYVESRIELIFDFFRQNFDMSEFRAAKLALVNAQISELEPHCDDFLKLYELEKWLLLKVDLIKLHDSDTELENFYLENWQYDCLKRSYVDWLIAHKKYEEATQAIGQILEADDVNTRDRIYYYGCLKSIYAERGDNLRYRNCLMELIQMGDQVVENFSAIKKMYDTEVWSEVCRKIIRQVPNACDRAFLYCKEKLYQELYDEVRQDQSRSLLQNYDRMLAQQYPSEILDLYKSFLNEEAERPLGHKVSSLIDYCVIYFLLCLISNKFHEHIFFAFQNIYFLVVEFHAIHSLLLPI